jgi:hypothetical protein
MLVDIALGDAIGDPLETEPPAGSSSISQVSLAISPARKPALTDSRTMMRLREG